MPSCASDTCRRPRRWWSRASADIALDGRWVCSRACVEQLVRLRLAGAQLESERNVAWRQVRLGALLRLSRACRPEHIDQALAAQPKSQLRLGEQLRAMGVVDGHTVLRALAEQAGVSYLASVDTAAVREAPGGLPIDAIHALGILPIGQPDKGKVRVAFPAPVPRAALAAFRRQTGWTPEPFLVGDDEWLRLLEHYGANTKAGATAPVNLVRAADVADAAVRVADAVLAAKTASLQGTRWGPYVWMRVSGAGTIADVLLEHVELEGEGNDTLKEDTWPAANTSR